MRRTSGADANAEDLRRLLQEIFRKFGVLGEGQTPCGKALSISHAHALMVLLEAEESKSETSQQVLSKVLGIDKSNVTRLCQKMTRSGHIVQARGKNDARVRIVSLTSRGRKLAEEVNCGSRERFSKLLTGIPAGQVKTVMNGLRALSSSLHECFND